MGRTSAWRGVPSQGSAPGIGETRMNGGDPRSVYVHAPFCARRCLYCDFAVTVDSDPGATRWLDALEAEWAWLERTKASTPEGPLRTLYVGGGTPSLLGPTAMDGLVGVLGAELMGGAELEWTAEANPESLTRETAEAWRGAGVNRLSLGAQTFHDASLRWMGRMHGPEGPGRAVEVARAAGFDSISLDLIFALPHRLGRSLDDDLDRLFEIAPPHVSIYGLTVEEGTPLGRSVREGREVPADEEQYADEFLRVVERLRGEGYLQYEVSNFARPGFESSHNQAYWIGDAYVGLGNGAHSFTDGVRRWNIRDWAEYSTAVCSGESPVGGEERIGPSEGRLERIWLSLRTSDGLATGDLSAGGIELATAWVHQGRAEMGEGMLRLNPQGWLLLDRLAVELASVEEESASAAPSVPSDIP